MLKYIAGTLFGALGVLAFAPFTWWWLVLISVAALFYLQDGLAPRKGFFLGFYFGLGFFGAGVSWIFNSIYEYGQAPFLFAGLLTAAMILLLSLFPAGVVWAGRKYSQRCDSTLMLVFAFASLWVLGEWVRGWFLSGFPWLLYGHVVVDSPLRGVIPLLGTYGASYLLLVLGASLGALLVISGGRATAVRLQSLTVAGVLVLSSIYADGIEWTSPVEGKALKVGVIQANISHEMKWDPSRRQEVLDRYLQMTRAHWDKDIIVWPETAIPMFYQVAKKDFIPLVEREARASNTQILTGVFTFTRESESIFNSIVVLAGNEKAVYSKSRLVPFGEYLPLRGFFSLFGKVVELPMSDISPGDATQILSMHDIPVGASVCYEAAYGEQIIAALPEAQLLANVSNDAWFGDSLAPHQHLQIARSRASETGRFMLRATNTGISAVIDEKGEILASAAQFEPAVVTAVVQARVGLTPFSRWGNWAIVTVLLAHLSVLLLFYIRSRNAITAHT